ncbi:MAG: Gfo/Idh/MocA family protein [Bacillota bacterium]
MQFGVIGAGRWGHNYLRILTNLDGVKVKWCCDCDPRRVAALSLTYPQVSYTTRWQDVVDDQEVDAVVIATPPESHFPLVMASLQEGKHVLVEKPCAVKLSDTQQLYQTAGEKKKVLMIGHVMEYNSALQWVKNHLHDGKLGNLLYAYFSRSNLGIVRKDVNILWDLAIHELAMLRFLLEKEPELVSAQGGCYLQPGIHDVIFITLRFPGNIMAQIHASWLESSKTRKATLIGDRQMVVFDDVQNQDKIWVFDRGMTSFFEPVEGGAGNYQFVPRYGDIYLPAVQLQEPLQKQCQHFIECITSGKEPLTGKTDALWVTKVAELAQQSLDSHGVPVPCQPD